jgi:hypothetical protein
MTRRGGRDAVTRPWRTLTVFGLLLLAAVGAEAQRDDDDDDDDDCVVCPIVPGPSACPGGANGEVQFTSNGVCDGEPDFTYEVERARVTVDNLLVANFAEIQSTLELLGPGAFLLVDGDVAVHRGSLNVERQTLTGDDLVFSTTTTWDGDKIVGPLWELHVTDIASDPAAVLMRMRVNGADNWYVDKTGRMYQAEATTDPGPANLAVDGAIATYPKNGKYVIAYNRAGTITYLTIPLNGVSTAWEHSTTPP